MKEYMSFNSLVHYHENMVKLITDMISEVNRKQTNFNEIYPVGHVYISLDATDPSLLFGGTWERIRDMFLLASGTAVSGTTGGEAEHTLTVEEMPSHTHDFNRHQLWRNEEVPVSGLSDGYGANNKTLEVYTDTTTQTGDGTAHNNMPPYLAVYMWKRIS